MTISIASYNTEKFVEETVNSLLVDDAHLNKMEIILVNDGSTDRTSELAHKLAAEHPGSVLVIDKENGGYGSTINASLSAANGKYYKLLDGDDWYNTRELPGFLDYLEKCEADLVVTPFYEVRGSDKLVDTHPEIPGDAVMIETQPIAEKYFAMHELAIRTDVLRSCNRQIAEHCFYTDTEYVFYCFSAAETIARYGRPIYRYRLGVDGQSVSLQGRRKHYKDLPILAKRIISAYTAEEKPCAGLKKTILCNIVQNNIYYTFFTKTSHIKSGRRAA